MNIYVMNDALQRIGVIDRYRSIIWTKRYYTPGDFELYLDADAEVMDLCKMGRYLYRESDYDNGTLKSVMIIEHIELRTSVDEGNTLLLQGHDLKSILYKRVVWAQTVLSGTLENNIRKIITDNIINPSVAARKISNFVLGAAMGGTVATQSQCTGDNIGEWVVEQLKPLEIGYDVQVTNGKFVFTLYKGADRSYEQSANPFVIFSPDFENLLTSEYIRDELEMKNVALVAGEGEGKARKTAVAGKTTAAGMRRNETFVDARDLSTDTDEGTLTPAQYTAQLVSRGKEELAEYPAYEVFEGEVEPSTNFIFEVDYFLGDKVQIMNEYGVEASARIIEIIDSEDEEGRALLPTFSTGDEEE